MTDLRRLTGIPVSRKKLNKFTVNGISFADEHLSLKLAVLFPERARLMVISEVAGEWYIGDRS